jgi:hypothetical protein
MAYFDRTALEVCYGIVFDFRRGTRDHPIDPLIQVNWGFAHKKFEAYLNTRINQARRNLNCTLSQLVT